MDLQAVLKSTACEHTLKVSSLFRSVLEMKFTQGDLGMLLGAYGWIHDSWNGTFYPEDLPQDWQLSYYSNEFNAVLVPVGVWSEDFCATNEASFSCEDWLDSVSDEFHFYIECRTDMLSKILLSDISLQAFSENLQTLQPQLAGLVVLDKNIPAASMKAIIDLADTLETAVFSRHVSQNVGLKDRSVNYFQDARKSLSSFALLEDDLLDLREVRKMVEDFSEYSRNKRSEINSKKLSSDSEQMTIIVNHPAISASDLLKFRSVLEIMGL